MINEKKILKYCPIILKINQLQILHYVKINHFEAQLMVSSRVVDSKVLMMAIQFEYYFFLILKAKWRM